MREAMLERLEELMRETFEGGLPGAGTEYLDHDSGIRSTLARFSAAQVSASRGGHPSVAAHVRHMIFHLRASHEWVRGDHRKRDWPGSFRPFEVSEAEWRGLAEEFERERREFARQHRPPVLRCQRQKLAQPLFGRRHARLPKTRRVAQVC